MLRGLKGFLFVCYVVVAFKINYALLDKEAWKSDIHNTRGRMEINVS